MSACRVAVRCRVALVANAARWARGAGSAAACGRRLGCACAATALTGARWRRPRRAERAGRPPRRCSTHRTPEAPPLPGAGRRRRRARCSRSRGRRCSPRAAASRRPTCSSTTAAGASRTCCGPATHKLYPSTSVAIYAEVPAPTGCSFRGLLDTREIRDGEHARAAARGPDHGRQSRGEELRSGNVMRELSALMGHDAVTVELGRFRGDVADGLVYKDFGTGIRVRADLEDARHRCRCRPSCCSRPWASACEDFESNAARRCASIGCFRRSSTSASSWR